MSEMSTYLENALVNVTLRNTSYTAPSAVYMALFTSDPTDAGSGTEVSGGTGPYARQAITFDAPADGVTQNSGTVTFTGMPTATITHVAIYDDVSAGNLLYYSALDASISSNSGDDVKFDPGDVTVTLT